MLALGLRALRLLGRSDPSHDQLIPDPRTKDIRKREMLHFSGLTKSEILIITILLPAAAIAATEAPALAQDAVGCGSNIPDTSITGCTALLQGGERTPTAWAAIYQRRAIAYYNKGLMDDAIADDTEVITLKPEFGPAYYDRAEAYLRTDRTDEAIDDYTKAISLRPRYAQAYSDRGVAYEKKGLTDQAIADETQAIAMQPGLAEAYVNRSDFYMKKGLNDEAIADCTRAIMVEPDYARPYYNRGLAKHAKGDAAGGDADIARAKRLNPDIGK
jgi:tetratricopeptide (TPR) repeat protein